MTVFFFVWSTSGWYQSRPGSQTWTWTWIWTFSSSDTGVYRGIFKSPLLNSCLTLGLWRIIDKKLPCWLKHIRSFLPSRRLIQVSVLHQLLQIFFTFNLSRWCTWVINAIILVAGTHVLFWCRNPVIKLSGLCESKRKTQRTCTRPKQTGLPEGTTENL